MKRFSPLSFILLIPVINTIADSTQGFFDKTLYSPGYLRAAIILIFIVAYFKRYFKTNIINQTILINIIYFSILLFLSSNFTLSLIHFLKFSIASLMFAVGYHYINTPEKIIKLAHSFFYCLIICIVFIAISNIFDIGYYDYAEDTLLFGMARVNITKIMAVFLLTSPLLFIKKTNRKKRIFMVCIIAVSMILVLIGVKRTAITAMFAGLILYLYFTPYKTKFTRYIILLLLLLAITSPLYHETLSKSFESRKEEGRFDFESFQEQDGRTMEIDMTLDAFVNGKISYKLFGAQIFNSPYYFKTHRMLHTDYTTVLAGSGIIGLIIYLLVYYLMLSKTFKIRKLSRGDNLILNILAINISLIFALIILGIAGTIQEISIRAAVFLFCGAALNTSANLLIKKQSDNQNKTQ